MAVFRYIGYPALQARAMGALTAAVTQSAEHLAGAAQAAAPVDTGTLRASIHVEGVSVGAASVEARVATGGESSHYAVFVHEGTGAHVIRPRNGKALAFGGIVVRSVNHPGTRAYKFLEGPLLAGRPVYLAAMAAAARGAF